jgi:NADPH-dependent 2,4-dienoyl-CoA reductase/sulfur reductase-like enzyme
MQGEVTEVDFANKAVIDRDGRKYCYDKVIISPGIGFEWDTIES